MNGRIYIINLQSRNPKLNPTPQSSMILTTAVLRFGLGNHRGLAPKIPVYRTVKGQLAEHSSKLNDRLAIISTTFFSLYQNKFTSRAKGD